MTKTSFTKIALALAIAVPGVASAQPIVNLQTLTSSFSDAVGGTDVTYNGSNTTTSGVNWGVPFGQPLQSGYTFASRPLPLAIDLITGSNSFYLGAFSHQNFIITRGSSISQVQLNLTLGFENAAPATFSEFFKINHVETPNGEVPCAEGGEPLCPDLVTFGGPGSGNSFVVDGNRYNLNLKGFSTSAETFIPQSENGFLTLEEQDNVAFLWADIALVVPEPTSMALMMFGFAGLGVAARRRRNA